MENIKPQPRPENISSDDIITPELVRSWVAWDREQEAKERKASQEECERRLIADAWEKETGTHPTVAEAESTLRALRQKRVAEAAEANRIQAARQYQQQF